MGFRTHSLFLFLLCTIVFYENMAIAGYSVGVYPSTTAACGSIKAVFTTEPNDNLVGDWIGLYKVGDPDTAYIDYLYIDGNPIDTVIFPLTSSLSGLVLGRKCGRTIRHRELH